MVILFGFTNVYTGWQFTKGWRGAVVAEWLSSWLAEQEVRGSIPRLATWISEIGYLPLPSRDMAEIPLKRRKSSIKPNQNQKDETDYNWHAQLA